MGQQNEIQLLSSNFKFNLLNIKFIKSENDLLPIHEAVLGDTFFLIENNQLAKIFHKSARSKYETIDLNLFQFVTVLPPTGTPQVIYLVYREIIVNDRVTPSYSMYVYDPETTNYIPIGNESSINPDGTVKADIITDITITNVGLSAAGVVPVGSIYEISIQTLQGNIFRLNFISPKGDKGATPLYKISIFTDTDPVGVSPADTQFNISPANTFLDLVTTNPAWSESIPDTAQVWVSDATIDERQANEMGIVTLSFSAPYQLPGIITPTGVALYKIYLYSITRGNERPIVFSNDSVTYDPVTQTFTELPVNWSTSPLQPTVGEVLWVRSALVPVTTRTVGNLSWSAIYNMTPLIVAPADITRTVLSYDKIGKALEFIIITSDTAIKATTALDLELQDKHVDALKLKYNKIDNTLQHTIRYNDNSQITDKTPLHPSIPDSLTDFDLVFNSFNRTLTLTQTNIRGDVIAKRITIPATERILDGTQARLNILEIVSVAQSPLGVLFNFKNQYTDGTDSVYEQDIVGLRVFSQELFEAISPPAAIVIPAELQPSAENRFVVEYAMRSAVGSSQKYLFKKSTNITDLVNVNIQRPLLVYVDSSVTETGFKQVLSTVFPHATLKDFINPLQLGFLFDQTVSTDELATVQVSEERKLVILQNPADINIPYDLDLDISEYPPVWLNFQFLEATKTITNIQLIAGAIGDVPPNSWRIGTIVGKQNPVVGEFLIDYDLSTAKHTSDIATIQQIRATGIVTTNSGTELTIEVSRDDKTSFVEKWNLDSVRQLDPLQYEKLDRNNLLGKKYIDIESASVPTAITITDANKPQLVEVTRENQIILYEATDAEVENILLGFVYQSLMDTDYARVFERDFNYDAEVYQLSDPTLVQDTITQAQIDATNGVALYYRPDGLNGRLLSGDTTDLTSADLLIGKVVSINDSTIGLYKIDYDLTKAQKALLGQRTGLVTVATDTSVQGDGTITNPVSIADALARITIVEARTTPTAIETSLSNLPDAEKLNIDADTQGELPLSRLGEPDRIVQSVTGTGTAITVTQLDGSTSTITITPTTGIMGDIHVTNVTLDFTTGMLNFNITRSQGQPDIGASINLAAIIASETTSKLETVAVSSLFTGDGTAGSPINISDNTLPGAKLQDVSVDNAKLMDNNIDNAKLIDNNINGGKLLDNTVGNVKLIDNNINGGKLLDGTVAGTKLTDAYNTLHPPIVAITQVDYDALTPPDANTIYLIT